MTPLMRAMAAQDNDAVRKLMHQLCGYLMTPDEMQDRYDFVVASPFDWLYVCELDGQVVGVLSLRLRERIERPGRFCEISAVVVDANVRRRGVGRALIAFAEEFARTHDCVGTWLVTGFKRKDEAHRFYAQLGYESTGYRFVKEFC